MALPRLRRIACLAAAAAAAALACSNDQPADRARSRPIEIVPFSGAPVPASAPPASAREARQADAVTGTGSASAAKMSPGAPDASDASGVVLPGAPQGAGEAVTPALIIRTGAATLQVDSLEVGLARMRQLVQGIPGAYVANTSLESGEQQTRRATLEVKVPAAQFDRLVAGLTPIGQVEAVNVTAEEVTEEFVDVTARVENARRLEARLVDLLARRTGKLDDILAVERELARVREEIERYEGRLRYLRTRAAVSTLSVTLHERPPVLGAHPGTNPIADAVRQGWRNFVAFVAGFISLLGVLVPLGVLAYAAWLVVRRLRPARPDKTP